MLCMEGIELVKPILLTKHYKFIDPFCIFFLHFLCNNKKANEKFWEQNVTAGAVAIWRGFAFENVCFNHIEQIKRALGISGIISENSAWSKKSDDEEGVQIDLLISRRDNVVNMCEIKYYSGEFTVTKDYYKHLLTRESILSKYLSDREVIHSTLITTFGLHKNEYSNIFTNIIVLDDLFTY